MIYLGNLDLGTIEQRLGIRISLADKQVLEAMHIQSSTVESGTWHCFDIPFVVVCGDYKTASRIYEILNKYDITGDASLSICVEEKNKAGSES